MRKVIDRVRLVGDNGATDEAVIWQEFIQVPVMLDGTQHPPQPGLKSYKLASNGHHLNPTDTPDVFNDPLTGVDWTVKP